MRRIIAIILMAVMCVSFAASCGKDVALTAEDIEGTWEYGLTLSEVVTLVDEENAEYMSQLFGGSFDFTDTVFNAEITFNNDGSCKIGVDSDNVLSAVKAIFNDFVSGMEKDKSMVIDILSESLDKEITEEDLDELLAAQGMTYEEYVAYMKTLFSDEQAAVAAGELADEVLTEGKYTVDGSRIYLDGEKTEYIEVEYSENEMKVTACDKSNAVLDGKVLKKAA